MRFFHRRHRGRHGKDHHGHEEPQEVSGHPEKDPRERKHRKGHRHRHEHSVEKHCHGRCREALQILHAANDVQDENKPEVVDLTADSVCTVPNLALNDSVTCSTCHGTGRLSAEPEEQLSIVA